MLIHNLYDQYIVWIFTFDVNETEEAKVLPNECLSVVFPVNINQEMAI